MKDKLHYICEGCRLECELYTTEKIAVKYGCPKSFVGEKPYWVNRGYDKREQR